jgi:predicted GIY-YIG superfamily endonuclease
MKDYSKGKIYKIVDESNGDVYIGSTVQTLKRRYQTHQIFKDYNKLKFNCNIILIEYYPCNNQRQLEMREQYYIDNNECINKKDAIVKIEKRREAVRRCNAKRLVELRPYKNEWNTQRIRYEKTWGGDKRFHNNLLMIDVNLFL